MMRLPLVRELGQVGFRIHETMTGSHEFVGKAGPAGQFPFSFEIDWGADRAADFVNPFSWSGFLTAQAAGVIRAGGLVDASPCEGSLELRYFSEAKVRYRLSFSVERRRYEYIGEKVGIRPWNLHRSHTRCYGVIHDLGSGKEISRSLCVFRLRTLPTFLRSFHLTFA
ncbi:MAG: hypothetical protein AB1640_14700 [bacterium]